MTALGREDNIGPRPRTTLAAATLVGTVLVAGLAGCGDGTGGAAKSTTDQSAPASATSTSGATSLQTASATGAQLQVPSDWHLSKQTNGTAGNAPPPSGKTNPPAVFSLQSSPAPLGSTGSRAQTALRNAGKNAKRLSDLHVNGVTLYHVQYTEPGFLRDDFGAIVNGVFYHIGWNFGTEEGITRAEADKYMNPVMATFKLTS